jgi:hypothetical protein
VETQVIGFQAASVAAPAIAAGRAKHDRPACVSWHPSQLPGVEVLRRPLEPAQYLSIRYRAGKAPPGADADAVYDWLDQDLPGLR